MKYLKLMNLYRNEILFLSYQKVKTQYLETTFGLGWALVKPMTFVFTFWVFFTIGLRGGTPVHGDPYLLYIFAAYMPWFAISEMINSGAGVIQQNSMLIKTIKFPVMSLPLINVLAKMYVHVAVMVCVWIFFVAYGGTSYLPDIYYINFIYYWITMIAFFTSLTFILASLTVIVKDVKPLVAALMQPLFWLTPVLYTPDTPKFELIMRLIDPLYYFIIGYKETLLQDKFFWTDIWYDLYIWFIIFLMYGLGLMFWKKIRPVMADLI